MMIILFLPIFRELEDFFGDMDFKVCGTKMVLQSIQMDIKIHGLTRPIVEEAIKRTREARMYILENTILPTIRAKKRSWQICTKDHPDEDRSTENR